MCFITTVLLFPGEKNYKTKLGDVYDLSHVSFPPTFTREMAEATMERVSEISRDHNMMTVVFDPRYVVVLMEWRVR